MNTKRMSLPAFFVFFNHEWCTERLTIPTYFARCIQEIPELVVLRDQQNNMWRVSVENVGDEFCFQAGWTTFTNDALLEDGDLIVFEYCSGGLFNVNLFDLSTCEKERAQEFIFKDRECNSEIREGNEHEGVRVEENVEASGEDGEEGEEETWEEDGNTEMDEEQMNGVDTDGADMEVEEGDTEDGAAVEKRSRNKRIVDIYGGELFRSGLAVKPSNPYFVTKITSRKGELYIPLKVLKNKTIKFAQITYLVIPNQEGEWRIKYKRWKDGRTMYSGWRTFCLANTVAKEDVCICEFTTGSRGPYIKVTIVRSPPIDL